MKLFNFFKKKEEKTILEKTLEEVERVCKEQPVKGIKVVDEHFKNHSFNIKKMKNRKRKRSK